MDTMTVNEHGDTLVNSKVRIAKHYDTACMVDYVGTDGDIPEPEKPLTVDDAIAACKRLNDGNPHKDIHFAVVREDTYREKESGSIYGRQNTIFN